MFKIQLFAFKTVFKSTLTKRRIPWQCFNWIRSMQWFPLYDLDLSRFFIQRNTAQLHLPATSLMNATFPVLEDLKLDWRNYITFFNQRLILQLCLCKPEAFNNTLACTNQDVRALSMKIITSHIHSRSRECVTEQLTEFYSNGGADVCIKGKTSSAVVKNIQSFHFSSS